MLVRVEAPAPIITLDEAKRQLREESADHDDRITALVEAATATIDGADSWLGRALGPQTWEARPDGCVWTKRDYGLLLPPLIAVESVTYKDAAGATQVFPASSYVVSGIGASSGGRLALASGAAWPAVQSGPSDMAIRFRAGYPDAGDPPKSTLPAPIRQAILLQVESLYDGTDHEATIRALLGPFRVWS